MIPLRVLLEILLDRLKKSHVHVYKLGTLTYTYYQMQDSVKRVRYMCTLSHHYIKIIVVCLCVGNGSSAETI